MNPPRRKGEIYGYLALNKLNAVAAFDGRLTNSPRRVLALLVSYADPDGTCCVAMSTIGEMLGVTRQAVQAAARVLERAGYFTSSRRLRRSGAEGAKRFAFNLELKGAYACPLPQAKGGATARGFRGEQPPEIAGEQPPEVAHKKPPEQTFIEDTSATRREELRRKQGRAIGSRSVRNEVCQQGDGARLPPILPQVAGSRSNDPPVQSMEDRIAAYNLDQRRGVSNRLSKDWLVLDPHMSLIGLLGQGCEKVWDRARDLEVANSGRGCRYIAGAVEKASGGEVTAATILSGRYAREIARRERPG